MEKFKFTKTAVAKLPYSPTRIKYQDTEQRHLSLIIGSQSKTYFVRRKSNGQSKLVKIGNAEIMAPEAARDAAWKVIKAIDNGLDAKARTLKAQNVTLKLVWEDFKANRNLKKKTVTDYHDRMKLHLPDWLDRPVASISQAMVGERHRKIGREAGRTTANIVMRILRSLINYAMSTYLDENDEPLIATNPVDYLTKSKRWFTAKRRTGLINADILEDWCEATLSLGSETCRDYLLLMILTGLRSVEARTLSWSVNIDLKRGYIRLPDTSTKNSEPHVLPMGRYLHDMLKRRYEEATTDWVFDNRVEGHLIDARKSIDQVSKAISHRFTPHDLRRTFATIADSLDIPAYALKRMLNHKSAGDVTAGYIVADPERLRVPMQMVESRILGPRAPEPDQ